MPILILQPPRNAPAEPILAFEMLESITGTVGGFLELSQMLTGRVPEAEIVLDICLTGEVRA